MIKNYKNKLILVTLILIIIFYLLNSSYMINNIIDYSKLFLLKLFPISFTLYVVVELLIDYGIVNILNRLFGSISMALYIFIISMISGFPSGSKYIKDLLDRNIIDEDTSNKMIMYTHFPNPIFLINSVNTIIGDKNITRNILISIVLSNFIIMLLNINKGKINNTITNNNFSLSLSKSINNAFKTMIVIYGTGVFFYIISLIIVKIFNINGIFYVIVNCLFDITKGIYGTSIINSNNIKAIIILITFTLSNIPIHEQVKTILSKTNIKYKNYIKGRLLGTILSIIIYFII